MVPGEALGGHLWASGWPKGTILATMGGRSGHFGAPWWPKVTILATMGGQSGHFGAHWWPKVAKRVKKEKPGTSSGNNNVVTGEKIGEPRRERYGYKRREKARCWSW